MESFISLLNRWFNLSDIFYDPDKKLIGSWQLFEFYTEPEDNLLHFTQRRLKEENLFMEIEFTENGHFHFHSNMPLPGLIHTPDLEWSRSRNFITVRNSGNPENGIEFQFAFQKNHLRLLNKDVAGRIIFFGFFTKPKESRNN